MDVAQESVGVRKEQDEECIGNIGMDTDGDRETGGGGEEEEERTRRDGSEREAGGSTVQSSLYSAYIG